jgi:hypothetical protein
MFNFKIFVYLLFLNYVCVLSINASTGELNDNKELSAGVNSSLELDIEEDDDDENEDNELDNNNDIEEESLKKKLSFEEENNVITDLDDDDDSDDDDEDYNDE